MQYISLYIDTSLFIIVHLFNKENRSKENNSKSIVSKFCTFAFLFLQLLIETGLVFCYIAIWNRNVGEISFEEISNRDSPWFDRLILNEYA